MDLGNDQCNGADIMVQSAYYGWYQCEEKRMGCQISSVPTTCHLTTITSSIHQGGPVTKPYWPDDLLRHLDCIMCDCC